MQLRYFLILVLCPLVCYWQIAAFQQTLKWDMMDQYFPFRYFIGESLSNGSIPWWNPYLNLGYPFHADPQSGFWYPFTWLLGWNGYSLYDLHLEFMLHIILAGVGMAQLLRSHSLGMPTATLIGLCYGASGFLIGNAQHFTFVVGACWIPWVLFFFHRMLGEQQWRDALGLALTMSLLLTGGYPALFVILTYLLLGYMTQWAIRERIWNNKPLLWKTLQLGAVAALVFGIIVAGYLTSFLESQALFTRGAGVTLESALKTPFPPPATLSLLFPFATLGQPDFWASDVSMINIYVGMLPLVVLPLGLATTFRGKWFWVTAGLLCLLASFGAYTPVRGWLYHVLPLMNTFRFPSVFRIFFIISLLVIAAQGLERLLAAPTTGSLRTAQVSAIVLLGMVVVAVVLSGETPTVPPIWDIQHYEAYTKGMSVGTGIAVSFWLPFVILLGISVWLFWATLRKHFIVIVGLVVVNAILATQFNINGTVLAPRSAPAYQAALNASPKGLPIPPDTARLMIMKATDTVYIPAWYNNTIFLKTISEQGYNPFVLKAFELYEQSPDRYKTLNNPLFYLRNQSGIGLQIKEAGINRFRVLVPQPVQDTLCLLQTHYPRWSVLAPDAAVISPLQAANGLMQVPISAQAGQEWVFEYQPGILAWLLFLQLGTQLILIIGIVLRRRPS